MTRQVRGALFVDYVRMVRRRKDVDWSAWLEPKDLEYLAGRIDEKAWYPMDAFQRLGVAILEVISHGDLEAVRAWGRHCAERLLALHPDLVARNEPRESLMRFQVVRQTFFDFPAVNVQELSDLEARLVVEYGMTPRAEAAAAHQVMGFFEQLLLLAGAERVEARFARRTWDGDAQTVLMLLWSRPVADPRTPRAPRGM